MKTIAFSLFLIALMALILFLWSLWVNAAFGATITHSHCPNHSRNNSDNMHTHDTSDPDHNDKHKAGHPHTWEFDEHCPPGTERDTSKKSNIQDFPTNPIQSDDSTGETDESILDDSPLLRSPNRKTGDPRICSLSKKTLAFWRSVFSIESLEYPVIQLKYNPETGDSFFDPRPLNKPFRLDVVVKSDAHEMARDGRCAAVVMFTSENRVYANKNHTNWIDDTADFTLDLTGKTGDKWGAIRGNFRTYPHCYIETLGEWTSIELRIGNCVLWTRLPDAPSAPSLHRNKTSTWASLKMQ